MLPPPPPPPPPPPGPPPGEEALRVGVHSLLRRLRKPPPPGARQAATQPGLLRETTEDRWAQRPPQQQPEAPEPSAAPPLPAHKLRRRKRSGAASRFVGAYLPRSHLADAAASFTVTGGGGGEWRGDALDAARGAAATVAAHLARSRASARAPEPARWLRRRRAARVYGPSPGGAPGCHHAARPRPSSAPPRRRGGPPLPPGSPAVVGAEEVSVTLNGSDPAWGDPDVDVSQEPKVFLRFGGERRRGRWGPGRFRRIAIDHLGIPCGFLY
eukprot:TRINITY_DN11606_c0_g1_i1.p1 TRINITY_DN11606_c0_g1~~TRINITY_DN11606_c0_g1_i1.p1  ORF type:complete len:290 (+),score=66.39 TRINITY_DN11606_c0_g1_i1:61-870(+)